ncbi:MAG: amidohydrolase family protein [Pirellulaceae bacterium]
MAPPNPPQPPLALPSQEQLARMEIWDSYFTAATNADGTRFAEELKQALPAIELASIRRLCVFLHVGLGTADAATEERIRSHGESITAPLTHWPERLLGMIRLNANDVEGSLAAIDRWLGEGPMVGVYFPGGRLGALTCSHRNFDPLVERIAELNGVIMQHTWFKSAGRQYPGESTPSDLAALARRHPQVNFLCAHAGGEWEQGVRAIRSSPNILAETSGFDPTAGFLEMAVRELGAERIVFGSHFPSRSLGTELGKVFGARITDDDRRKILGGNLRRLLAPILETKSK